MAELKVVLKHGLKLGEHRLKTAFLREAGSGDVIDAQEEAEKLVFVNEGGEMVPTLVSSPTLMGAHVLRRQVARMEGKGEPLQGPLTLAQLKSLSTADMHLLQQGANQLDAAADAASRGVAQRGRGAEDGPSS